MLNDLAHQNGTNATIAIPAKDVKNAFKTNHGEKIFAPLKFAFFNKKLTAMCAYD